MKKRIFKATLAVIALLALILSLVACGSTSAKVKAADDVEKTAIEGTKLTWEYSADDKTLTIKGEGAIPDKAIADVPWYSVRHSVETVKITATNVTAIGNNAFYYMPELTKIELPESVTAIGDGAFAFCSSLTAIEIPSGVTKIGEGAFEACIALKGIFVPANVESVGARAFAHCAALKDVYLMSPKLTAINANTFLACSSMETLYFSESLKGEDGKLKVTVDATAFTDAKLNADAARFSAATQQEVTITVNYVVPTEAPTKPSENPLIRKDKIGANYSFTSPVIEGYTADVKVVEGIYTEDKTITVTYTANVVETEEVTDTEAVTDVAETEPEGDKKIDVGQIIAISIFVIVIIGIVVFAVFMIKSDKKDKDTKGGKSAKSDNKPKEKGRK